jgi:hypothetical protein
VRGKNGRKEERKGKTREDLTGRKRCEESRILAEKARLAT